MTKKTPGTKSKPTKIQPVLPASMTLEAATGGRAPTLQIALQKVERPASQSGPWNADVVFQLACTWVEVGAPGWSARIDLERKGNTLRVRSSRPADLKAFASTFNQAVFGEDSRLFPSPRAGRGGDSPSYDELVGDDPLLVPGSALGGEDDHVFALCKHRGAWFAVELGYPDDGVGLLTKDDLANLERYLARLNKVVPTIEPKA